MSYHEKISDQFQTRGTFLIYAPTHANLSFSAFLNTSCVRSSFELHMSHRAGFNFKRINENKVYSETFSIIWIYYSYALSIIPNSPNKGTQKLKIFNVTKGRKTLVFYFRFHE